MEYMGDNKFWNEKFLNRGKEILPPESMLVKNIEKFKKGTVLDIACGDGRNTLFLLRENFYVTAIDFSDIALERLNNFCASNQYLVKTEKIDLSRVHHLQGIETFDNIIINHYKLRQDILENIHKIINQDGILFINGFGHKHKPNNRIGKEDLIYPTDFEKIKIWFDMIEYIETTDERGFFSTYIFRRRHNI